MRGISFVVAPIRDHAFFEQTVLQRQVGDCLLQRAGLATKVLHFTGRRSTGRVACQSPLAGFQKFLRPGVVEALGDPLLAAQLGNAVFATKTVQHDPDLVFRGKVPPCRPADVFDHMLGGAFAASRLRIHVRSFVLDENRTLLKSHPQFCAIGADPGQLELRLAAAKQTPDPSRRETEIEEAEAALAKLDRDFSDANKPDYARKLYLIDKCL